MPSKQKPEAAAVWMPIGDLTPWADNPRDNAAAVPEVARSITRFGFASPIIARPIEGGFEIIAGHTRHQAALSLGLDRVPVRVMDLDPTDAKLLALADNRVAEIATWTDGLGDLLKALDADGIDLDGLGFGDDELTELLAPLTERPDTSTGSLTATFGAPPVTLLDSRQGYWQDRKRLWLSQGIRSELGRGEEPTFNQKSLDSISPNRHRFAADIRSNVTGAPPVPEWANVSMVNMAPGTSVFDPVLAELLVRWFSPDGGTVLDPFAGGSVRGVIAAMVGRHYTGIELRPEQVKSNSIQWEKIRSAQSTVTGSAKWIEGDSAVVLGKGKEAEFDMVLSCPPYGDLEVYSDDPDDLSAMDHDQFHKAYRAIIEASVERMAPDSFAAWVVGDYRDKNGLYRNFVGDTISAFLDAGTSLYNEAVLVTPMGTLQLRAGKHFRASRKLGKTHQNVLVFVKGDPKKAADKCGVVDLRIDEE